MMRIAGIFIFLLLLLFAWQTLTLKRAYNSAKERWLLAHETQNTDTKQTLLNEALAKLLKIYPKTVVINQAIGTILIDMQRYPDALYYYLQAAKQDPGNAELKFLIENLVTKAQFPPISISAASFLDPLSITLSIIALTLLLTLWIWWPSWQLLFTSFLIALVLLSQTFTYYLNPIKAILVQPASFYTETQETSRLVLSTPLLPGKMVTVLDLTSNGTWVKIRTEEGAFGYVLGTTIRILD